MMTEITLPETLDVENDSSWSNESEAWLWAHRHHMQVMQGCVAISYLIALVATFLSPNPVKPNAPSTLSLFFAGGTSLWLLRRLQPDSKVTVLRRSRNRRWAAIGIVFILIALTYANLHWLDGGWYAWVRRELITGLGEEAWSSGAVPGRSFGDDFGNAAYTIFNLVSVLLSVLIAELLVGMFLFLMLLIAGEFYPPRSAWLAYALVPAGGFGLVSGLLVQAESALQWPALSMLQQSLPVIGAGWSIYLAATIIRVWRLPFVRSCVCCLLFTVATVSLAIGGSFK